MPRVSGKRYNKGLYVSVYYFYYIICLNENLLYNFCRSLGFEVLLGIPFGQARLLPLSPRAFTPSLEG